MTSTLHIVVAMKPLDGNFASNAIKHGVAGLNVDACRIGTELVTSTKGLGNNKNLNDDGWKGIGHKPQPTTSMGRFPANVIHDGSKEIVKAFPNRDGFSGGGIRKQRSSIMPSIVVREDGVASQTYCDTGSAARFFKQVKES